MYYLEEIRISPLMTIRRERLLPVRGEVLVRPGEVVGPPDVVARCQLPGKVRVVDMSRSLGIWRERVEKYVRKAIGDHVQEGEILAAPWGLLAQLRSCRSPVDGQVITVRNGMILIEAAPTTFELRAHVKGQVTNVMPELGVVVSTVGTLIQGVWGSGGEAEGVLKALVDSPQKPIRPRSIDVSCHGTLVAGGRILDEKVFERAIEAKVRGIIIGSIGADMRSTLEALPFPVLLTEGFGTLAMSRHVFELLHSNLGREAMLNAETQTRWDVKRPEVLIPLRSEEEMPTGNDTPVPLKVGMLVRVSRTPYLGQVGTVTHLPELPQPVESGARLLVAEVDFDDREPTLIPLANLELIR